MSSNNAFIEIIPLGNVPIEAGCVTPKMCEIIQNNYNNSKKTLIFYNRRGSASAWICQDCGFFEKCPNCDIAFSYHTFPRKRLICHQCSMVEEISLECPNCHGAHFSTVGVGIEQVAHILEKKMNISVGIISSDHIKKNSEIPNILEKSDVILSTNLGSLIVDDRIGAVIFALFELNSSIPAYDMEEELYAQIAYIKKQQIPLYIQTFSPENRILQAIVFENFRNFLEILKTERKNFSYPPYVDFVTIRVHHTKKEMVQNIISGLVERIQSADLSETFFAFDRDIWEKSHGEWMQKIILKGRNVSDILEKLSATIVKSRYISVEWH